MAKSGAEILVFSQYAGDLPRFRRLLDAALPGIPVAYAGTEADARPHLETVRVLYGWGFPRDMLRAMPKLRWIQKMGAGVEDMVRDWPYGESVLLTRTDGRLIAPRMVEYVLCAILRRTLRLPELDALRARRRWEYLEIGSIRRHCVGVAGLGEIGGEIAKAVRALGARAVGWRRTRAPSDAVDQVYAGLDEFAAFLAASSVVVLVLPMTGETAGLMNERAFEALKPGTHLINVGRGGVVDETALTRALERGRVSHATLDVFAAEPLPDGHPFWSDPRVSLTPHLCGPLIPEDVAPHFIDNFHAFREQRPLRNRVAPERQY
jgi:glyoxylate/hydroxypyruvate reductase A